MDRHALWEWGPRFKRYIFGMLVAVECLMSFTFLGYIHIPPISITFAYIPILVAGCFLGIAQSTVLGLLFGLSSMFKASAHYVMPTDKVFSPFLSEFPVGSVLLSVGTRVLFGFLVGVLFALAKKSRHARIWSGVVSLFCPKLHSFLVYAAMGALFPELGYGFTNTFRIGVSDVLVSVLCVGLVEVIWKIYDYDVIKKFNAYIELAGSSPYKKKKAYWAWGMFIGCILCAAITSAFYFAQRMAYMLGVHGLELSSTAEHDLLFLQIQFLIATLSLNGITVLSLIIVYKYLSCREYLGQLDTLTGVMGRKMFANYCDKLQGKSASLFPKEGWFIFVDVDHFKSINDTFGHPVGDDVLKGVAKSLSHTFLEHGGVGRMGGDEFAVILEEAMPLSEVSRKLDQFLSDISDILLSPQKVTCSMGVCRFSYPQDMQTIYSETDKLLYTAKEKGRACYVIGEYDGSACQILR